MPINLERLPLGCDQRIIYNSRGTTNAAVAVMNNGELYDARFDTSTETSACLPFLEFARLDQLVSEAPHRQALSTIASSLKTDLYTIQQYIGSDPREGIRVSPILGVFDRLQLSDQPMRIDSFALTLENESHLSDITGSHLAGLFHKTYSNVETPEDKIDSSQN